MGDRQCVKAKVSRMDKQQGSITAGAGRIDDGSRQDAIYEKDSILIGNFHYYAKSVDFSACGRFVAVSGSSDVAMENGSAVKVWDTQANRMINEIHYKHRKIVGAAFVKGEMKSIAAVDDTGVIEIRSLYQDSRNNSGLSYSPRKRVSREQGARIAKMAVSPDAKLIAYDDCAKECKLRLWSIGANQAEENSTIGVGDYRIHNFKFSPDGAIIAITSLSSPSIFLFDAYTGQKVWEIKTKHYSGGIADVAYSPDGQIMAVVPWASRYTKNIELWHISLMQKLFSLPVKGKYKSAVFSPNGRIIAVVAENNYRGHIELIDIENMERVVVPLPRKYHITFLAFSPSGEWLATLSSGMETAVRLWNVYSLFRKYAKSIA